MFHDRLVFNSILRMAGTPEETIRSTDELTLGYASKLFAPEVKNVLSFETEKVILEAFFKRVRADYRKVDIREQRFIREAFEQFVHSKSHEPPIQRPIVGLLQIQPRLQKLSDFMFTMTSANTDHEAFRSFAEDDGTDFPDLSWLKIDVNKAWENSGLYQTARLAPPAPAQSSGLFNRTPEDASARAIRSVMEKVALLIMFSAEVSANNKNTGTGQTKTEEWFQRMGPYLQFREWIISQDSTLRNALKKMVPITV